MSTFRLFATFTRTIIETVEADNIDAAAKMLDNRLASLGVSRADTSVTKVQEVTLGRARAAIANWLGTRRSEVEIVDGKIEGIRVVSVFYPDRPGSTVAQAGWRAPRKDLIEVSVRTLLELRRIGAQSVSLGTGRRVGDFTLDELLTEVA